MPLVKSLHRFVLRAFSLPFIITFMVVLFILVSVFLIQRMDYFLGKDLPFHVLARMMFYFSMNMVPKALPLAVLVASLITFGNLGEHNELTAIKSAGISLTRIIYPVFMLIVTMTVGLFWFANNLVPEANLRGYSLLYDIKQKKPGIELREKAFYSGIPGYTIRIEEKNEDNQGLKGVLIYDHHNSRGNNKVIMADSGQMYTMRQSRYLVLELFDGANYIEMNPSNARKKDEFSRSTFQFNKIIFDLSSFQFERTDVTRFSSNKLMKDVDRLWYDIDSMLQAKNRLLRKAPTKAQSYFPYAFPYLKDSANYRNYRDTLRQLDFSEELRQISRSEEKEEQTASIRQVALNNARNLRSMNQQNRSQADSYLYSANEHEVEAQRKFAMPVTVIIMFLIGAPLGAIIKKGGLGLPMIVAIIFFIIYYVVSLLGERWAKEQVVSPYFGMWLANMVLIWPGLYFLWLARNDSTVLEMDFYTSRFKQAVRFLKRRFRSQAQQAPNTD